MRKDGDQGGGGGKGIREGGHSIPRQDLQLVASLWHALEASNLDRLAGEGLLDDAPASSAQGAQLAPVAAHHHVLPHLQAAPLHNGSGHGALPLVQLGLHHHSLPCTAGAGPQIHALRLNNTLLTNNLMTALICLFKETEEALPFLKMGWLAGGHDF